MTQKEITVKYLYKLLKTTKEFIRWTEDENTRAKLINKRISIENVLKLIE